MKEKEKRNWGEKPLLLVGKISGVKSMDLDLNELSYPASSVCT